MRAAEKRKLVNVHIIAPLLFTVKNLQQQMKPADHISSTPGEQHFLYQLC